VKRQACGVIRTPTINTAIVWRSTVGLCRYYCMIIIMSREPHVRLFTVCTYQASLVT